MHSKRFNAIYRTACHWWLSLVLIFFTINCLEAQTSPFIELINTGEVIRASNEIFLRAKVKEDSTRYKIERDSAIRLAKQHGYPISGETKQGSYSLQGFDDSGQLEYYSSNNATAAAIIQTSEVHPGGDAGLNLTGDGWAFGVWEISRPRTTHIELNGRVTQMDNSTQSQGNHATHVCGTLVGSGLNPQAKGMAYEAQLLAYDANNDIPEMAAEGGQGLRVSNHSYGTTSGWRFGNESGQEGWHWWGNTSINTTTDYKFGLYDSEARDFDAIVYNNPFYLPVKSAGNDRGEGPSSNVQHWVRNSSGLWVSSTANRNRDGNTNGFDCIPTTGTAKNILTVGAIDGEVSGGLTITGETDFSGWGPTDDGRIKPDIVADGVDLVSSGVSSNTDYDQMSGTSMASPTVAGSLVLLLEHYENLNPGFTIRAAALKALVIHTAAQFGAGDGPSYKTGWGLMQTRDAADLITESFTPDGRTIVISRDTIKNSMTRQLLIYHDGDPDGLKATIAWTDPPGPVSTSTLNSTTARLVNDLDIRLIALSDNTTYQPWVLNPASPASLATKGDNSRDNVEQIWEKDLPSGYYVIQIKHKGTLFGGNQLYSLILSGRAVPPPPVASFTATPTSGTAPLTVNFVNTSTNATGYTWTFPGGTPSSFSGTTPPSVVFQNAGTYTVTLTASGPGGTSTKTEVIVVNAAPQPPVANFTATPTSGTAPLTVNFVNTSTNATGYAWTFPGGTPSSFSGTTPPSVVFQNAGTYTVTLTASGPGGTSTKTEVIVVNAAPQPPVANFTATPTSGTAPLTVNFVNTSTNATASAWTFPGGTPSSFSGTTPPLVVFQNAGTYTVTLTASGPGGTSTKTEVIVVNAAPQPPVANFTATPTSGTAPLTVNFVNTSTNATGYTWTFPGGNPSSFSGTTPPSVVFQNAGTYTVTLTASGPGGTSTKTEVITVNAAPQPPVANFTATPTSGTAPLTVNFVNTSTNATGYVWTFPGGTPSSFSGTTPPSVVFQNAGTYTVTLTASGPGGTSTKTEVVTVNAAPQPPVANFTATPTSGTAPLTVNFVNTSTNATAYAWTFPGGTPSSFSGTTPPSVVFQNAGTYTVTLTASGPGGTSTKTEVIVVNTAVFAPVVDFSANVTCGTAPLTVQFSDLSTNVPDTWTWQFPGGSPTVANSKNATVVYNAPGTYQVSLNAANAGGSNSVTKTGFITVLGPISLQAIPGTTVCAGATVTLQASGAQTYQWSGVGLSGNTGPLVSIQPPAPGNYNYAVIGTTNNCSSSPQLIGIQVVAPPTVSISAGTATLCLGDSTTLTASGAQDYNWSGTGIVANQGATIRVKPTLPGTYNYSVIGSQNGCTGLVQNFVLTVNPVPVVNANAVPSTICLGQSVNLNANGANSYSWSGPGLSSTNGAQVIAIPPTAGVSNYSVVGSSNGCSAMAVMTAVNVNSLPQVQVSANAPPICTGDTITLTAIGATQYVWSGPGLLSTIGPNVTAVPTTPGTATYTAVGMSQGCNALPANTSVLVQATNVLSVSVLQSGCPGPNLTFTANVANGGSFPNILWYRNGQPAWSGPSFQLLSAANGDVVYCTVEPVNPPDCTSPAMVQSSSFTVNCIVTDLSEIPELSAVRIVPNPNNGAFVLQLTSEQHWTGHLRVYNALGQLAAARSLDVQSGGQHLPIHLPEPVSGLHWLVLESAGRLHRVGFVVIGE